MYRVFAKSIQSFTTSSIRNHIERCHSFKRADAWRRRDRLLFSFHALPPLREEQATPGRTQE